MRGKKIDTEFLSLFINDCLMNGVLNQEEIAKKAKTQIADIDFKIKEVEKLKVVRSKLLDVVSSFEKKNIDRKEEIQVLNFLKIQNQTVCKFICSSIKKNSVLINSLYVDSFQKTDIVFCIKQLIEHHIINRVGDYLFCGEFYEDYAKLILCEI